MKTGSRRRSQAATPWNAILRWVALAAVLPLAEVAGAAHPVVSDVSLSQTASYVVKVSYRLTGAPAVVTVDFQTNSTEGAWVSIGAEHFRSINGDVNKLIQPGFETLEIAWKPRKEWPGVLLPAGQFRAVLSAHDVTQPPDWLVVDLNNGEVRYYDSREAVPGGVQDERYKTTALLMRRIPASGAEFLMGDVEDAKEWQTPHRVSFTNDYYMSVYETTQAQYINVIGSNPSSSASKGNLQNPVNMISFNDVRGTADWPTSGHETVGSDSAIFRFREITGVMLDLPTEAQWEYACRAGTTQRINNDMPMTNDVECAHMEDVAWARGNSNGTVHPVGLKPANAWGLHDMHGNVFELCLDWVAKYGGDAIDPWGPVAGEIGNRTDSGAAVGRVARGGSYEYNEVNLVSGARQRRPVSGRDDHGGFRLVAPALATNGKGDK